MAASAGAMPSTAVSQTVNTSGVKVVVVPTPTSPTAYQAVTFTVAVGSTSGSGTPTGTVQLFDSSGKSLGTATLVNGIGTIVTTKLDIGADKDRITEQLRRVA